MPYQANDQETCLFCLGEAEPTDPLKKNTICRCKYSYHDACYARYDRKEICPLCKRRKGEAQPPQSAPAIRPAPSAPSQHITITVTLPRETTTPYTPLAQAPPSHPTPFRHRKLTPLHLVCLLFVVLGAVGMIVGIIIFYN